MWIWITLYIVGFFVMMLYLHVDNELMILDGKKPSIDTGDMGMVCLFWPPVLTLFLIYLALVGTEYVFKSTANKIAIKIRAVQDLMKKAKENE